MRGKKPLSSHLISYRVLKLGPHDAWYVFVVRHVWMCQKDSSNLTHSLLWCVNLPPNWGTRCDEWTNDTSTQIRHIFSYTRCANHDIWLITNTNHASCGPSFRNIFDYNCCILASVWVTDFCFPLFRSTINHSTRSCWFYRNWFCCVSVQQLLSHSTRSCWFYRNWFHCVSVQPLLSVILGQPLYNS